MQCGWRRKFLFFTGVSLSSAVVQQFGRGFLALTLLSVVTRIGRIFVGGLLYCCNNLSVFGICVGLVCILCVVIYYRYVRNKR